MESQRVATGELEVEAHATRGDKVKSVSYIEYKAIIGRIVDGDTIVVDLDLGRHLWVRDAKHRLQGCNAIEHNKPGGQEAKANLESLLPIGTTMELHSFKPYKFGDEYMCDIVLPDRQLLLVDTLIRTGWVAPWDGNGSPPLPAWPRAVA